MFALFDDFLPALPEIFLAGILCVLMVVAVYLREERRYQFMQIGVLLGFGLTAMLLLLLSGVTLFAFNHLFINDDFAFIFKIMVLLGAFFSLIVGNDYIKRLGFNRFEYPLLAGFAVLGMMMMLSAHDLMSLYIGLELQSLSLYVLASMRRDDRLASEASLKYFVLGALASCLLLYGASLIYGFLGATEFNDIANAIKQQGMELPKGVLIGLVFIIIAIGFKVSAVPFHMWTPDVYMGVPTSVTVFFALAPKIAAFGLFIRLLHGAFGGIVADWQPIIMILSALSMVLGGFAGIWQRNIKRLLAYSSIGHIGFALMGFAAGDMAGVNAVAVYLMIYLVTTLGSFACVLAMMRKGAPCEHIEDLSGFGKSHPFYALCLMLFMFSMAGIPPLAGFFAKWYVFVAAIDAGLIWLAVIGALSSVVSAYYYIRIIKVMYFEEAETELDGHIPLAIKWVVSLCAIFVVLFVAYPDMVSIPAHIASNAL